MSKRVNRGAKGFAPQSNKKTFQTKQKEDTPKQSKAYLDFLSLVEEGDMEKLTVYFSRYAIAPGIAKLNMDSLVRAELRDLST